jgi:hypothetical protein
VPSGGSKEYTDVVARVRRLRDDRQAAPRDHAIVLDLEVELPKNLAYVCCVGDASMGTKRLAKANFELREQDRLPRAVEHEADALVRFDRRQEQVPRVSHLDVGSKTRSEGNRITVEMRKQSAQRAARALGLRWRPLASDAKHLANEGF